MNKKLLTLVLGLGLMTALAAIPAGAQTTPPADGGAGAAAGGGGRGGRGNFDPAAMRQRRMDDLKTALAASDDEWKILQPKIEKVEELRSADRAARFSGMGGGRRGGGGGGGNTAGGAATPAPAAPAADNSVAKAAADLKTVLDNKESTPDQIKEKLAALRDARTKAKADLTAAQAALKEIITVRQEAVLVAQGVLE